MKNGGVFQITGKIGGGKAGQAFNFEINKVDSLVIKTMVFKEMKEYLSVKIYSVDEEDKLIEMTSPSEKLTEQRQQQKKQGNPFEKIECYGSIIFRRKWNSKIHKVELIYEYTN